MSLSLSLRLRRYGVISLSLSLRLRHYGVMSLSLSLRLTSSVLFTFVCIVV
jgi:hypothetical protein